MISNAVGLERISKTLGYKITKGNFAEQSPNLPQRIAIIAEANDAQQSGLSTAATQLTSAQQAGTLYGFGSPIYHIMRILKPVSGDGVGGIPVWVYPQEAAAGAAARVQTITVTGTATANGTHYVVVGGRYGIDGTSYAVNIVVGDTPTVIAGKIKDAINAVLGSPLSATNSAGVVTVTTKWSGLTSQGVSVSMDSNNVSVGATYAVAEVTAGSGTPSIPADIFGNEWNTIVINSYGTVTAVMSSLESINGLPDPSTPSGRYSGTIMKPFVAFTGTVADDPSSISDARKTQCTLALCPAPGSAGLAMEAAANYALLAARCAQDTPHLDISGQFLPDMPVPASIGSMASYDNRDLFVKKGCSTVDLVAGLYQVQDFVTTYHPVGETPAQFAYVRNLFLDFNVRYGYYLLEQLHVVDHALAKDTDTVSASKVVKPKMWKAIVKQYANDLANRALIADAPFMQASIQVDISGNNPDRLETFFRYKRTGYARIESTTAEAGFNFGNA